MTGPYPQGVRLELDAETVVDGAIVIGGSPGRLLRLSATGTRALASLRAGPVRGGSAARLARLLTDAGAAHPSLGPPVAVDATVVIPVRDRAVELDRCLAALGPDHPVVVVDDGSTDAAAVAGVCARHGARLLVRPSTGGPAAARTTGLAEIATPYVLLLDSDCVPPPDLLARLAAHVVDPLVAAVAPRIRGTAPGAGAAARYSRSGGALDLGERPARVAPGSRVSYVPTAALLVRRAALDAVGGFDVELRYGEDVDLVWRLVEAGWRVRYEPGVVVAHEEPASWPAILRRRFAYGTSAGPLAGRHPGAVPPLVLHPWSALTVAGVLARRPLPVLAGLAGLVASTVSLRRAVATQDLTTRQVIGTSGRAAVQTWLGVSRWTTQFASPALAAALVRPGRRAASRRAVTVALLLSGAVRDWRASGRDLDPVRYCAARIADDVAYGAGVVAGSLRARTTEPLRPVLRRAPRPRNSS